MSPKLYKDSLRTARMKPGLKAQRQRILKLSEGPPKLSLKELSAKTLISENYLRVVLKRAKKEREDAS